MRTITVAVLQPSVEPYDVEGNLARYASKLRELKSRGAQLVLLPEFFPTGNTLEPELLKVAIETSERTGTWLRNISSELGIIVAGSYLSLDGSDVYNKFLVQEPDGTSACHLKTHSPAPESLCYVDSPEADYIVETSLGKIGLIICIETFYKEVVETDFAGCALILIDFAIPNTFGLMPAVKKRLTEVPRMLAKRNGVPVLLSSMGGRFSSKGSAVMPVRQKGRYIGRSGVYLPSRTEAGPLGAGGDETIVTTVPLGPRVEEPDPTIKIPSGLPFYFHLVNRLKGKASKIYQDNLGRWR